MCVFISNTQYVLLYAEVDESFTQLSELCARAHTHSHTRATHNKHTGDLQIKSEKAKSPALVLVTDLCRNIVVIDRDHRLSTTPIRLLPSQAKAVGGVQRLFSSVEEEAMGRPKLIFSAGHDDRKKCDSSFPLCSHTKRPLFLMSLV